MEGKGIKLDWRDENHKGSAEIRMSTWNWLGRAIFGS